MMNNPEQAAINTALRLLAQRSYAAARLYEKICEKGHDQEAAAAAVASCTERGYLDDRALARRLIERQADRGYGGRRIAAYLQSKGIEREMIQELLEEREEEAGPQERQEALLTLCRKLHKGQVWDVKEKNRVSAALARRGFGWDEIKEAVREACEAADDD